MRWKIEVRSFSFTSIFVVSKRSVKERVFISSIMYEPPAFPESGTIRNVSFPLRVFSEYFQTFRTMVIRKATSCRHRHMNSLEMYYQSRSIRDKHNVIFNMSVSRLR